MAAGRQGLPHTITLLVAAVITRWPCRATLGPLPSYSAFVTIP